jgi:hypothetical protein
MMRIPIFGKNVESISPNISAQKRVNCYYEVVGTGEKEQVCIRGTPGLTLFITLPTYPIRGMCEAGTYLYVVAGNTLFQICQNGGFVGIANIPSGTTPVSMAINETQLMIVDGSQGYIFDYNNSYLSTSAATIATIQTDLSVLTTITQAIGFP